MDRVHPVVSILLPLYNGERYLDEAIRSVLKQSFSDWELIVQDDCSTDRGLDLVKQYKDPRIIHGANAHNLHIARTLNAALTRANGKYIQLLAQDDRLVRDCVSTFVSMMERHSGLGFSFCAPYLIDVNGNRLMAASPAHFVRILILVIPCMRSSHQSVSVNIDKIRSTEGETDTRMSFHH